MPLMECARCGKDLTKLKKFIEKRYCNGKHKDGKYRFGMFCVECEPHLPMGEYH